MIEDKTTWLDFIFEMIEPIEKPYFSTYSTEHVGDIIRIISDGNKIINDFVRIQHVISNNQFDQKESFISRTPSLHVY